MRQIEALPAAQYAVQLVGPGHLVLNTEKEVAPPGPHEILVRVESVGLCFSDVKLLKQFSAPAEGPVVSGISQDILENCQSYVPGERPGGARSRGCLPHRGRRDGGRPPSGSASAAWCKPTTATC